LGDYTQLILIEPFVSQHLIMAVVADSITLDRSIVVRGLIDVINQNSQLWGGGNTQEQITGVSDMSLVERLEIVLQPVHVLAAPEYCSMLRELACA
jgi:hypothetical protein